MSEFIDYLPEVFQQFGAVRARRMFGGYGLYHDDLMFGLIANDTLYLKADNQSAKLFEDKGLGQFEYVKNGKSMKMSYYLAPEEIFDDYRSIRDIQRRRLVGNYRPVADIRCCSARELVRERMAEDSLLTNILITLVQRAPSLAVGSVGLCFAIARRKLHPRVSTYAIVGLLACL